MRKLLNTLYVTNEQAYLELDGGNIVCRIEGKQVFRVPFDNIEAIVSFAYIGCSPALMSACVSRKIPISFISPRGKFQAKLSGETKGNVFLRVAQIDCFRVQSLMLAQHTMAAKFANSIKVIKRTQHDNARLRQSEALQKAVAVLKEGIDSAYAANSAEMLLGVEGNCARAYFSVFGQLIINKTVPFVFQYRNKRPPLDPINALLSFVYTLATTEYAAALESVGLDSAIGYYHTLRSGRASLACDLVEEARCIVERFVLTIVNLKIVGEKDFERQISGAVWLNEDGRKKVLTKWQEKKRTTMQHPFLKQKIQFGLLPYVQANLLAKYIRGDLKDYPCFLAK